MTLHTDVLVVPMQPTPNGRLHIGHGAGTYLRADVVARSLKLRGHRVLMITGSDAYENWVLAEAALSGRTPEETCERFHAGIRRDLANLSVDLDEWIDPRSDEHAAPYRRLHEAVLDRLRVHGAARMETERVPVSATTGEVVIGTWIAGRCPNCAKPCGGSSCVYCGEHFQPEELLDARSRLDDSPLVWHSTDTWFARPLDVERIADALRACWVRADFLDAALRYLASRGGRIRLSGPGSWGIRSAELPPGTVLANPYYLYSVYCGCVYQERTGAALNPFDPASDVTTIGVFGNDNSAPGLVAPQVIAQGSGGLLKPFDITVVNGMLHFQGQKCSTSKRHGIWLSELLDSGVVSADELRCYLSDAALDEGHDDVALHTLVERTNSLRRWHRAVLAPVVDQVRSGAAPIACDEGTLRAADRQQAYLDPRHLDLPRAAAELRDWMAAPTTEQSGQWLVGLALLCTPLLPGYADALWRQLGHDRTPTLAEVRQAGRAPRPTDELFPVADADLTVADLTPHVRLGDTPPQQARPVVVR